MGITLEQQADGTFRQVDDPPKRFDIEQMRRISELEDENKKLRDELDFCLKHVPNCDGCEAMLDCWECLRADSSQKERKRLDYENGQLRELCKLFSEYVSYDRCEGCICKSACSDGEIDECVQLREILETAHELEIDVH